MRSKNARHDKAATKMRAAHSSADARRKIVCDDTASFSFADDDGLAALLGYIRICAKAH